MDLPALFHVVLSGISSRQPTFADLRQRLPRHTAQVAPTAQPLKPDTPIRPVISAGRITNCQIGVLAAYVSVRGHTFVDQALYLPRNWTADIATRLGHHLLYRMVMLKTRHQVAARRAHLETAPNRALRLDDSASHIDGDTGSGGARPSAAIPHARPIIKQD